MGCPGIHSSNIQWPQNYNQPPYQPHQHQHPSRGGVAGNGNVHRPDAHDIDHHPTPKPNPKPDPKPQKGSGKNDVISRAIDNISNSGFAKLPLGRQILNILKSLNEAHKIYFENLGGNVVGMGGDGRIRVDDDFINGAPKGYMEEILVHEATHELQRINGTPANEDDPAETERILHQFI